MIWLLCLLSIAPAAELEKVEHPWRVEVGPVAMWWKSASRHLIAPGAHLSVRHAYRHLGITYDVVGAIPHQPGPSYDIQYLRLHQAVMVSGFLGPSVVRGHAGLGPSMSILHTAWRRDGETDTVTQVVPGVRWNAGMEGQFLSHGTWSWRIGGVATSFASMDFDLGFSLGGEF